MAYNDGFDARTLGVLTDIVQTNRERIEGDGMSSSASAMRVRFDEDNMWVDLSDGRTLGVPLAWFPRLLNGTREQWEALTISSRGLHWESLDEDISIAGLLAGLGDQTASGFAA